MLLKDYYPAFLMASPHFASIINAQQSEINGLVNNLEDVIAQLCIDTATWGLDTWEQMLGVKPRTATTEERRALLKSLLAGMSTTSAQSIKNAAIAYQCGNIDVIESPSTYSFKVVFKDVGIPSNLNDFLTLIETIKPAHLAFTHELTYITHAALSAKTHAQLKTKTHAQIRNGVI